MEDKKRLVGNDVSPVRHSGFIGPRETIPRPPMQKNHLIVSGHDARPPRPRPERTHPISPQKTVSIDKKPSPKAASEILNKLAYDLIAIVVFGFISIATSLVNWAFLIYGIYVLIRRIPSQRVFISALICLVSIPILTVIKRDSLASNFAIFTFFFLVIGTIRAGLEIQSNK